MDTVIQFLDKAVCISGNITNFGKRMNPTNLSSAMGRLGSLTFVWQLV